MTETENKAVCRAIVNKITEIFEGMEKVKECVKEDTAVGMSIAVMGSPVVALIDVFKNTPIHDEKLKKFVKGIKIPEHFSLRSFRKIVDGLNKLCPSEEAQNPQ